MLSVAASEARHSEVVRIVVFYEATVSKRKILVMWRVRSVGAPTCQEQGSSAASGRCLERLIRRPEHRALTGRFCRQRPVDVRHFGARRGTKNEGVTAAAERQDVRLSRAPALSLTG